MPRQINVLFDDGGNEDLISLHHHRTDAELIPTLVENLHLVVEATNGAERARVVELRAYAD